MAEKDMIPFHQLTLYRNILQNTVLQKALYLLNPDHPLERKELESLMAELQHDLIHWQYRYLLEGQPWKTFVAALLWEDENVFSLAAENNAVISEGLLEMVYADISCFGQLFHVDWETVHPALHTFMHQEIIYPHLTKSFVGQKRLSAVRAIQTVLETETVPDTWKDFYEVYRQFGCGKLAINFVFRWDQDLVPIENPVLIPLDTLVGYAYQKKVLCQNTQAFIETKRGNHVLLFGEKGTGKSTSVKAMLHEFAYTNLRMIELGKQQIHHLGKVIDRIKGRGFRFILFIDDLSFEDTETAYKELKSFMEGNLEATPDNMVIYATSNRRNIIKESWEDRAAAQKDVHISDTYQEKLSLVERFGITLGYYSPDQETFLGIVEELARRHNLQIPTEELRRQALQWERKYHGRSGRTARQFITYLAGQGSA